MMDTAETAFFGHQGVELNVEQVADYPYAAAYLRTDKFPQVVAVLDRTAGAQRVYRSGGEEAITTHYGRILTSYGIPGMPLYTSNLTADPLTCLVAKTADSAVANCAAGWQREIEVGNYGENELHKWQVSSSFTMGAQRRYQHPNGTALTVTEITEQGDADQLAFTNTFYAVDGRVVYAKQWISPSIGYAVWREMKPFNGDLQ
ncbi:YjbF family lipoprotein [Pseudidiomarina sp. E22-M8]|uniref:YjbF family lipoprotein n=1 Tax=Pseudidiomarina sp. E22-M8 TaxID=3424768 RepID=UPI00403CCFF7